MVGPRYLLDTNVLSSLIKQPAGTVADRIRSVGANYSLIAAHALSSGLTLVTDNIGEFSRVRGLNLENWLGS